MPRPRILRDEGLAAKVKELASQGVPQVQIAKLMGISVPTLERLYRPELDAGIAEADAELIKTAFDMAVKDRIPSLVIFLCKTRLGMSETQKIEQTTQFAPAEIIEIPSNGRD